MCVRASLFWYILLLISHRKRLPQQMELCRTGESPFTVDANKTHEGLPGGYRGRWRRSRQGRCTEV